MNTSPISEECAADYWERRYADAERMWTGKVNEVLAEVSAMLPPGRALDLGCGEGGDVIWLAMHGWFATGLDISSTAIRRARDAAHMAGLPRGRADFQVADITDLSTGQTYDLVSASFLHSPAELARGRILRRAADHVAPGGCLLITSHAVAPPWARAHFERSPDNPNPSHPDFHLPEDEIAMLALDEADWETRIAQVRRREATTRHGETATLTDGIVLLHRLPG